MAGDAVPGETGKSDAHSGGGAGKGRRLREALRQRAVASLLLLCLLLLVIIWTSIAAGLRAEKGRAEAAVMHEAADRAQLFEDLVVRTLGSADESLRYLAAEYLRQGRSYDIAEFARVRAAALEPWHAITMADENGDIVLASPPLAHPVNVAHREMFAAQRAGSAPQPLLGAPHSSVVTGQWTMPMSRRIVRADGSFAGVVSIGLDPAYFSNFQDRLALGPDSTVTLVGTDGIVRARRSGVGAASGESLRNAPLFTHVRRAREGTYLSPHTVDGIPRFFAYRVLDQYPLIVTVGIAEAVAMERYRHAARQYLAWAAAITFITLFFAGVALAQARRQVAMGVALRASEARYRSFVSATSRITWTTDAQGRAVEDAPTWRAYTGQTLDGFRGEGWLAAVHAEDRDEVRERWARAVAERSIYEVEYRLRGADGVYRLFLCKAAPVMDEDGSVQEWLGVVEDVTARQQAERARAMLAMIVEHAHDAIVSRTLDGIITTWNSAAERMFGYTAAEAIGQDIGLVRADDRAAFEERNARIRRGEAMAGCEGTRRTKDGRILHVVFTAFPILNDAGAVVGAAAIVRDVSESKKAQAGLELAARIYENAAEGLAITDAENRIVSVNGAYSEITGEAAEAVVGRVPHIVEPGQQSPAFYEALWDTVRRTGRWQGEVWGRRRSGERYCVLLSVTVARDESGRIAQHCWILMDVTAGKRYEQQLVALNAELEKRVAERTRKLEHANQELSAFSYSVSHDLRAPIRAIQGFSTLLLAEEQSGVSATALKRLQRIQGNAEAMGQLIDDLLHLARVSQRELERSDFDLSALAEAVVHDLRREDPGRQVEVRVQPGMVTHGDASLVRHVLDNLIGNAWKFTSRTPGARIEVAMEHGADQDVFYVQDNGAGFDMQYAHKLFSAFQRLHRREDFEGTGIGLSIVQRVIVKHGGTVWARAEVGRGATFYFTLA